MISGHPTRWTLETRELIEINTDPQRRCYNGCHAKSEKVWTDWAELGYPATKEEGEESIRDWQSYPTPRTHEYRLVPPTGATT